MFDKAQRRTGRPLRGGHRCGAGCGICLRCFAREDLCNLSIGQGREPQHPAARADCRQQAARAVRDQQEKSPGWGFLQAFKQSVGGAFLQIICWINDNHAATAERRPRVEPSLHQPDFIDRDRALAFIILSIFALRSLFLAVCGMFGEQDVGMAIKRWLRYSRLGDQFRCCGTSEFALAHSFWARKQPRVVHPRRSHRLTPFAPSCVVAEQRHGRSSSAASTKS